MTILHSDTEEQKTELEDGPSAEVIANSDTTPPGPLDDDFEDGDDYEDGNPLPQTPQERKAERDARIAQVVARVMPSVKARKIGFDPKQPWLSNPHIEATVKATIEILYDLDVANQE